MRKKGKERNLRVEIKWRKRNKKKIKEERNENGKKR